MNTFRAHVLDPSRTHRTLTWTVGEHVTEENYERFKDDNGDLYVLVYHEDGKQEVRVVLKHDWERAKTALDQQDSQS
jgi:hypothetical protein